VEIAPDGKHVAVERRATRDGTPNIWLIDVETGLQTQFTFDGGTHPKWSPDGRFLLFNHERAVHRKRVDGSGVEEEVVRESDSGVIGTFNDWAPSGRAFVMRHVPPLTGSSTGTLLLVTPGPELKTTVIPQAQFNGRFSPDGKWLAYTADENGGEDVYVQPYPITGAKWIVSHGGGVRPRWRRDGKELFYIASSAVNGAGRLMAVPIQSAGSFRVGTPVPLFDVPFVPGDAHDYPYSLSADGQRILVIQPTEDATRTPFTLVFNWVALLRKR
jgi:Tol biopolymer transport system component